MSADKRARPALDPELIEDLEDLYEHAPCGYLSILDDGAVLKVNDTFLRWTGYAREVLLRETRFTDLLTAGGRIFYETHLKPLLRMQGFVHEIALEVVCRDGRRLPVLVNAAERRCRDDVPPILRVTLLDATERRAYERELLAARERAETATQERTNLINTISHDIRAPLSTIVTATTLLEHGSLSDEQLRIVKMMRTASNQALALVNGILDLNRLDAGRDALRARTFDLSAIAEEIAAAARLGAEQNSNLEVRVSLDERIPRQLVGDPEKIAQVLTNLMTNAVKFTPRGAVSLTMTVRESTAEAVTVNVQVSDTGIGIPPDRLPYIFDEYNQAGADIRQRYGGTGLGLAIVRRLLRIHGSEISVVSTPGQGTSFAFPLTLKRPTENSG